VSVDGETLTTRPISFQGRNLFINAAGQISVEVLDNRKKALAATTLTGDSLRLNVMFEGKSLGDVAPGRVARLRFTVADGAELYSFTVQ
jgi:hypothetical protein